MKSFDKIGEAKLRAVLADFYDRVFADVMIGFMFQGKDKQHLIDREYEMTAKMLGAQVAYAGRPMRTAHAAHTIFGGWGQPSHFGGGGIFDQIHKPAR